MPKINLTITATIPKTNKNHKTGNYFSTLQVCKILGIDHKTYRRYEGTLFPSAQRNPNTGFRIFTKDQVKKMRVIWGKRAEYLSNERHYHYHKTRNFYSLFEACRLIGISRVTFKKHEGILFPFIWRDDKAGRRLFTEKDIAQIKETWEKHKKRK